MIFVSVSRSPCFVAVFRRASIFSEELTVEFSLRFEWIQFLFTSNVGALDFSFPEVQLDKKCICSIPVSNRLIVFLAIFAAKEPLNSASGWRPFENISTIPCTVYGIYPVSITRRVTVAIITVQDSFYRPVIIFGSNLFPTTNSWASFLPFASVT